MNSIKIPHIFGLLVLTVSLSAEISANESKSHRRDITFNDIAAGDGAGITYRRVPSERFSVIESYQTAGGYAAADLPLSPLKSRGAPGVALFDYDKDGDLDIYVTNGPGQANSLYQNQFAQYGVMEFQDVASYAGVAATEIDATGTCFGDIDNDNDQDLLVLAFNAQHKLYQNNGDSTFTDISTSSGITHADGAMSCAMGDVDGNGLLDIVVANLSNLENVLAFVADPFLYNVHNQLFLNAGGNTFSDESDSSGVRQLAGVPVDAATMTWAVTIADMDLDGDQDIVFADDQAGMPNTAQGGVDRGYFQLLDNDGNGKFSARAISDTGEWMGIAVSDLNCDGTLDVFGSNFGDYGFTPMNPNYGLGDSASRWLLQDRRGEFSDPGVGRLVATSFGWGTSALDFDNDRDPDLVFHGGMDLITALDASNAGALLENHQCRASFSLAQDVFTTDHSRRAVQGVAVGDLNNDGFVDIVSVSSVDVPKASPLFSYDVNYGSVFDEDAFFLPIFTPAGPDRFAWTGQELSDGTLSVEINSASNGNNWLSIDLVGTTGLLRRSVVNRDGIGAVVSVRTRGGRTNTQPVLGGSSYASQDSLTAHFGLGSARQGTVDVMWPGGVRNRLYNVGAEEHLVFPEIPCSYDDRTVTSGRYINCVSNSLNKLVSEGVINRQQKLRFFVSAVIAYYF